jgi:hypothetical protein
MKVTLGQELWVAEVNGELLLLRPWMTIDGHGAPGLAIPRPIVLREGAVVEIDVRVP